MRTSSRIIRTILLLLAATFSRAAIAQEEFEGWNLEPSVGQAELIMIARVTHVSSLTTVEGGPSDIASWEFRFQPVRLLKGIFTRDELSMSAADLGLLQQDMTRQPLEVGELRILILVQRRSVGGLPIYGCDMAAPGVRTFAERVPKLTGVDDALVSVVETLIRVADSRSRKERATLLVDQLENVDGVAAVPLLTSLKARADWAAADEKAFVSLARLAREPLLPVRSAAVDVLRDMLAHEITREARLDGVAEALRTIIQSDESVTSLRLAALEAIGNLITTQTEIEWTRELLVSQLTGSVTFAERAAAVSALSRDTNQGTPEYAALIDVIEGLPLDVAPNQELAYANAAIRILPPPLTRAVMGGPPTSERLLITRLKRSLAARQSLQVEIDTLGQMETIHGRGLILEAATKSHLAPADRHAIAHALGQLKDDRAVPVLVEWVRATGPLMDTRLKELSLAALEAIDSPAAAREARPLLITEQHLPYKLRIARLLARHGIDDGYSLATEHLADTGRTAMAALVLASLDDPRTVSKLSAILDARPDRRWRAAALTGLVAVGDAEARAEVLEILDDDRHPLAADAAEAAGISDDPELLPPLAQLARSRNEQIAMAALLAVRRYLSDVRNAPRGLGAVDRAIPSHAETVDAFAKKNVGDASPIDRLPAETRTALAETAAELAADAYVSMNVRNEAFAVARLLGGEGYDELLDKLADQAELEGQPLLTAVQNERRR